jgi:2-C-methyl-D-erythritol 4-phosphate cytidylyltransferase
MCINKELGIIIVAGGTSARFKGKNKLLEYLLEYPVFIYSLLSFRNTCPDNQIVLVCHSDLIEEFKRLANKFIPNNRFVYTTGGTERYNSVIKGLNTLPKNIKYVAIHDAARPLANKKLLYECLDSCMCRGNGVAAKKINDTVKRTANDEKVIESVDRTNLWAVETPQVFKIDELKSAYKELLQSNAFVTDDAGAMENAGFPVYLVESPNINIKITHQSDIEYVKTLIQSQ